MIIKSQLDHRKSVTIKVYAKSISRHSYKKVLETKQNIDEKQLDVFI